MKSFSINIPLDRAILQLHSLDAPQPVLHHFLAKISDARRRLVLARKLGSTKSSVDALVELKDRKELEMFIAHLAPSTEVRFYAENALKNLVNFNFNSLQ